MSSEKEVDMEESQPKSLCEKALTCIQTKWKQLILLIVVLGVIGFLIWDVITSPCTLVENESDRRIRLFCVDSLEVTMDGDVIPGQDFICANITEEDPQFVPNADNTACTRAALCSETAIAIFAEWFRENQVAGIFAAAGVYCVASLLLVPGSVLTITTGIAFGSAFDLGVGTLLGTLSVVLGATTSAVIAFLLGRYLLREYAMSFSSKVKAFKAVDHVLGTKGLQIMLLLRLSPVVPFSATNYLMGATACTLRNYAVGTFFGIIPGTAVYIFVGASIGAVAASAMSASVGVVDTLTEEICEEQNQTIQIIIISVGIVATIIALVVIVRYARKEYNRIIEAEMERERLEEEGGEGKAVTATL